MKKWLWWILAILVIVVIVIIFVSRREKASPVSAPVTEPDTYYGVSLSPKSFSASDLGDFYAQAAKAGTVLSWAGSWKDLAGNTPVSVASNAKQRDLLPVIITGPQKEEIDDPGFVNQFSQAIGDFAGKQKPKYLGVGNEIDEFYRVSPALFTTFAQSFEQAAAAVKAASPETIVFPIFQYEHFLGLNGGLFGGVNDESKALWSLLDQLPSAQAIGFTTYPMIIYKNPSELPANYYSRLTERIAKPIMFTEIGWTRVSSIAGWESTPEEQAEFINEFMNLASSVKPKIVIWPFIFDQTTAPPFEGMGLLGKDETTSAGWQAWADVVE